MTQERKQFQRTEDGHLILMSNEERNLLITDLTARINYGVICLIERVDDFGPIHRNEKLTGFCFDDNGGFHFEVGGGLDIVFAEKIMPYIRSMSSMTDEEREHLQSLHDIISDENYGDGYSPAAWEAISEFNDYCHAHHLDNRGLICKGLALEAPEQMYD